MYINLGWLSKLQQGQWGRAFVIFGLFTIVAILEWAAPHRYLFSYLYIGPILLVGSRYGGMFTFLTTLLACCLTILSTWMMGTRVVTPSIPAYAVSLSALVATGFLSHWNRVYQQRLSQQQVKIAAQEKLSSLRKDFASTLTHDLKTPLLGAIATLEALEKEDFGPVSPPQKTVLATIIRSHQTSLQLVETLLDVYRYDLEGLRLTLLPVDLVKVAEEVAASLVELAAKRHVHLSCPWESQTFSFVMRVQGDVIQLQRVFANLLTNAINHSPRGGRVELVFESQDTYHMVKVMDQGVGITAEEMPYLFERFYQGHSDRQAKGSGLGLYLTRQIVEAHRGLIWVENRQPQGAIFTFCLPVLP